MSEDGTRSQAVLLVSHGTVERLDDLAEFVTNVRRGRPPPPELVDELRRRYESIGRRASSTPALSPFESIGEQRGSAANARLAPEAARAPEKRQELA